MPLFSQPQHNFTDDVEAAIKDLVRRRDVEKIILSYGTRPEPWAHLSAEGKPTHKLNLPPAPSPDRDWKSWFGALEGVVITLCRLNKVSVYVMTNRGNLAPLYVL